MKKKFCILSVFSSVLFVLTSVFTYFLYHYYSAEGFGVIWQEEPFKPFVTFLFGILATLFLFSSILSFLIALIFYKK